MDDDDILDSPGYYQKGGVMKYFEPGERFYPRCTFLRDKKGKRHIVYVLVNGKNQYVRLRWWGGFQLTSDRKFASEWSTLHNALKWAQSRGLA